MLSSLSRMQYPGNVRAERYTYIYKCGIVLTTLYSNMSYQMLQHIALPNGVMHGRIWWYKYFPFN